MTSRIGENWTTVGTSAVLQKDRRTQSTCKNKFEIYSVVVYMFRMLAYNKTKKYEYKFEVVK
jgi:hypothetical protein